MLTHPFISDLSQKTIDELAETITKLNKQMQYMYRLGKTDMVSQIQMAISSYKSEYARRQQELWDKKNQGKLDKKIDIS